jgi:cytoskeletal protein CcmA (bactofilin family)
MWWKWWSGKRSVKTGDLTAFIDEGSEIEGKYTFSGTVMLNGKFRGEIASTDTLIIGAKGIIQADIQAATVLISGQVVGDVAATQRVELHGTARVCGDIEAPILVVEEGVRFDGHCRMTPPAIGETPESPSSRDLSVVSLKRQ